MTTSAEIQAVIEGDTVPTAFLRTVEALGDLTALRWKNEDGSWGEKTYGQYADEVSLVAAGLANLGVGRGDRVMLMIRNRPEFHVLDVAVVMLGAIPVSIYNSSSREQVEYLCADAGAKVAVVEDQGSWTWSMGPGQAWECWSRSGALSQQIIRQTLPISHFLTRRPLT